MNDQKIYQYLARKPDSRAQDIADVLDVDLKDASEALRGLVDIGDVVRHSGIARNGHTAQLYNLSLTFKRSKEGAAMVAAAAAVVKEPAPAPAVVVTVKPAPQGSKVDRAVELVQKGSATDDQLRAAMGLTRGEYPSAYLNSAIKSGRIHKGANGWARGRAPGGAEPYNTPIAARKDEVKAQFPATAAPEDVANVVVVGNTILASKDHKAIAPEVVAAVAAVEKPTALPAPPVEPDVPVYRCGLWSDGVLELQRNGRTVLQTTQREHEFMADFLKRTLGMADQPLA